MSAKSQFLASNNSFSEGDNILGSLTLACKDVRGGHDAPTTQLIGELKGYADTNKFGERFDAYVEKITPVAKATAPSRAPAKPGNGNGMM